MQNFTTLQILLQEVFATEDAAEIRCNQRTAEDYILQMADQIRAKRVVKVLPVINPPALTVDHGRVTVTLIRDGAETKRTFPLKSFFVYRTNEKTVSPRPGKDGYTWYMRNYSLAPNGEVETYGETLEPYEGPILYDLLSQVKR